MDAGALGGILGEQGLSRLAVCLEPRLWRPPCMEEGAAAELAMPEPWLSQGWGLEDKAGSPVWRGEWEKILITRRGVVPAQALSRLQGAGMGR